VRNWLISGNEEMNFICRQTQALTDAIRHYAILRMRFRNGVLRESTVVPAAEAEEKPTPDPTRH